MAFAFKGTSSCLLTFISASRIASAHRRYSLGKAFSTYGSTTMEGDSELLNLGFWHAVHSRFYLTCSIWVPLDSEEKTWLFGLSA